MQSLKGKVAVVVGATRGAGRGIACMLGEAGATVYCTGRSTRADRTGKAAQSNDTSAIEDRDAYAAFDLERRPETIEETAELVESYGGVGIPVRVDHTVEEQVEALFARVRSEQGRLDILVNDIWGGDALTEWDTPFWQLSIAKGRLMIERAVIAHIIASRYGARPCLVKWCNLKTPMTL